MSGLVGHSTYSKSGLIGALPAFEAKSTNNQSNMNNNTSHTFDYNIEWIQGPLTNSSNVITTHLTGRYYFFWNIYFIDLDSASNTGTNVALSTSNRTYENWIFPQRFDSNGHWTTGYSCVADMDAGDTAKVTFYLANGHGNSDIHGDSRWGGHYLGPRYV